MSYRTPRLSVSWLPSFQSSCTQPANRFRVIAYWCSVSDSEWYTHLVMGASGAVFQVEASFQTGKSDSILPGPGEAGAAVMPVNIRHTRKPLVDRSETCR